ncbi:MAG: hypothetical protein QGH85_00410 [Candidatus Pacebacteria bacterium]|jgi:hypothetical protein|nr:hypothetical protein [Parcubacteria group bacterium]MDP6249227.1 hypothetical protein [Candidatus Paceibacterota bacterium]MDP7159034.1 hypothetical protein [Candidatus Paceibacterota bacterium]MDP7366631.1 hypothetical protein [Candidatus Paceibacterota bacterium]MDP7466085.1 hypothetical protein [Candidatus Paceibacterota bacterium]|tara:strand:- start:170 stop:358 length:189 start_codon:yes stop_codon:yes gene_type:complete
MKRVPEMPEFYQKTLIEGDLIDNTFFWTTEYTAIVVIISIIGLIVLGINYRNAKKREDAEAC